jgi:hypothetical protein
MGPGSHINTGHGQQLGHSLRGPGQAERGREDVPEDVRAGTARTREGIGPRSYINTLGHSLRGPWQAGRGREYVPALQGYEKVLGLEDIDQRLTRFVI